MNKLKYIFLSMVIALTVSLISCDKEDEPTAPLVVVVPTDSTQLCQSSPESKEGCCTPEFNVSCYCGTGDNGTTDTTNCCLFEFQPACFCEKNPDDSQCKQSFGEGNGLGIIIDFESDLKSFSGDYFNSQGKFEFNGNPDSVDAIEGENYFSMIYAADEATTRAWHDYKYWPTEQDDDGGINDLQAGIDFTNLDDPTLNIWVNTGTDTASVGVMRLVFRGLDDGTGNSDETDYEVVMNAENDQLWFNIETTFGEWKLMSFPLKEMKVLKNYGGDPIALDVSKKWTAIKFVAAPDYVDVSKPYELHMDAISITDGALTQLPSTK